MNTVPLRLVPPNEQAWQR